MLLVVFFAAGAIAGLSMAAVFCIAVGLDQESRGGDGGWAAASDQFQAPGFPICMTVYSFWIYNLWCCSFFLPEKN
jgi:hypothetical protein